MGTQILLFFKKYLFCKSPSGETQTISMSRYQSQIDNTQTFEALCLLWQTAVQEEYTDVEFNALVQDFCYCAGKATFRQSFELLTPEMETRLSTKSLQMVMNTFQNIPVVDTRRTKVDEFFARVPQEKKDGTFRATYRKLKKMDTTTQTCANVNCKAPFIAP